MECRYERVPWSGTTREKARKFFYLPAGSFWRAGDAYRFIEPIDDGTTREYLVRGGQGLWLRKGGPLRSPVLHRSTPRPVDGTGGDMWRYLLFSHWGWDAPSFYTLEEILDHPHSVKTVERLPTTREIHLEFSHGGVNRQEFWFDPKVNYLIRKSVWVPADNASHRLEDEVIAFTEPVPGVFVPTTVEHRAFVKEKQEAVIRTVISELKVNHNMPPSALRIPGIEGLTCIDEDRSVSYSVDADGNRVGPEKSVRVYPAIPRGEVAIPPESSANRAPIASSPPTPFWVWLLIVSALVLIAGLGLGIVRRRRQAAENG